MLVGGGYGEGGEGRKVSVSLYMFMHQPTSMPSAMRRPLRCAVPLQNVLSKILPRVALAPSDMHARIAYLLPDHVSCYMGMFGDRCSYLMIQKMLHSLVRERSILQRPQKITGFRRLVTPLHMIPM